MVKCYSELILLECKLGLGCNGNECGMELLLLQFKWRSNIAYGLSLISKEVDSLLVFVTLFLGRSR
jgi:hypothetical protein